MLARGLDWYMSGITREFVMQRQNTTDVYGVSAGSVAHLQLRT
jgi:hypothetical protein